VGIAVTMEEMMSIKKPKHANGLIWPDIERIRAVSPLVLNITNYVVMNTTANALLAIGASPIMANASEEIEEMTGLAKALVINIGTLSQPWIDAMIMAGKEAVRRKIPVVLDPVGCGATQFRTRTVQRIIEEVRPSIIRGNASEIRAVVRSGSGTKGVDSLHTPDEILEDARTLSKSASCVVSVSGPVDLIVEGDKVARIANGHPIMTRVTGMGCTSSAITGAFAAVSPAPFDAAIHAMAMMGVAGEVAAERAGGPGSFQMHLIDVLHGIDAQMIEQRVKLLFAE
jgi:hydroxyethylthiazole kinase